MEEGKLINGQSTKNDFFYKKICSIKARKRLFENKTVTKVGFLLARKDRPVVTETNSQK